VGHESIRRAAGIRHGLPDGGVEFIELLLSGRCDCELYKNGHKGILVDYVCERQTCGVRTCRIRRALHGLLTLRATAPPSRMAPHGSVMQLDILVVRD